jgi:hypothetical protein
MSKLYRGPSIDASYQVSVLKCYIHFLRYKKKTANTFSDLLLYFSKRRHYQAIYTLVIHQYHFFSVQSFYTDSDYPFGVFASYQVSVHLAKRFQRRKLKCEKLKDDRRQMTDDGRQTTDDGHQVMAKANLAFGKVS